MTRRTYKNLGLDHELLLRRSRQARPVRDGLTVVICLAIITVERYAGLEHEEMALETDVEGVRVPVRDHWAQIGVSGHVEPRRILLYRRHLTHPYAGRGKWAGRKLPAERQDSSVPPPLNIAPSVVLYTIKYVYPEIGASLKRSAGSG